MKRRLGPSTEERRILILASSRQDAVAAQRIISREGLQAVACLTAEDAVQELVVGAAALLVAEDAASFPVYCRTLNDCLSAQPPWSEIPLLIAVSKKRSQVERLLNYQNVVLLERPLRSVTLLSALRAAIAARRRQYEIRQYLEEREAHEELLRRANETLEQRVEERTRDLEEAMRQRESAEAALRQSQKVEAIGQLTGGIAHDFNNLLMVFTGGLTLLERRWHDPGKRDSLIGGMRKAAQRGQALTKQLLAFARKMTLDPQPVQLQALIDDMRVLLDGALRDDIRIEVDIPADLWPLVADRTQLELAILNLAVNARDAMPDGGTLRISANNCAGRIPSASLIGDFVAIEIKDTGTGIPHQLLNRVFDPFFTTKAVGKGTGLGLSQVYGFARQSGGETTIASEVGAGTSVTVFLPRAELTALEDASSLERCSGPAVSETHKTVLLVEDNFEVSRTASEMLQDLGFSVLSANSASEALAILDDGASVDILFSDVVMPGGMNGVDLARESRRRRPNIPILLASGYSEALQKIGPEEGLLLLEKPYELRALESALREVTAPLSKSRFKLRTG